MTLADFQKDFAGLKAELVELRKEVAESKKELIDSRKEFSRTIENLRKDVRKDKQGRKSSGERVWFSRTEDGRPICFNCRRPGHLARDCNEKSEPSSPKVCRREIEPPPSKEKSNSNEK